MLTRTARKMGFGQFLVQLGVYMLLLGTFKIAKVEAYNVPVQTQAENHDNMSVGKMGRTGGDTGNITSCDESKLQARCSLG